jgi:hypothetical protein
MNNFIRLYRLWIIINDMKIFFSFLIISYKKCFKNVIVFPFLEICVEHFLIIIVTFTMTLDQDVHMLFYSQTPC